MKRILSIFLLSITLLFPNNSGATIQWANNATSLIADSGGITSGATSVTVTTGEGDKFPEVASPHYFMITFVDVSGNREIVKVTARASGSNTMTIVRGQEGTSPRAFAEGSFVDQRITASSLDDFSETVTEFRQPGPDASRYANFNAAVAGTAAGETLTVSSSMNLTSNIATTGITVKFTGNGEVVQTASYTLDIPTLISVDNHIFSNFSAGEVTLGDTVIAIPEWWNGDIQSAIESAEGNSKKIKLEDTSYTTSDILTISSDLTIYSTRDTTVTLTVAKDSVFDVTGKLIIRGGLTIDADSKADNCIYFNTDMPELEYVIFKNSNSKCLSNENDAANAVGELLLDHCEAIDCGRGFHAYGVSGAHVTSVRMLDCKTSGTTGDEPGNIWYFQDHVNVQVIGGHFEGDAGAGPNAYICDNVQITGGYYKDILRGPTVGKNTKNFTITGNTSNGCVFSGISIDLKDGASYPDGHGVVVGNTMFECGYSIYSQAKKVAIIGNISVDNQTSGAAFRINGADDVYVDGNTLIGVGANVAVRAADSSVLRLGDNYTDSTHIDAYAVDATSRIDYANVPAAFTAAGDISNNYDIIQLDCTAGVLDFDLPPEALGVSKGKKWLFIKVDNSANKATISIDNADGTINGGASLDFGASAQYSMLWVVSIGGGAYIGYAP